MTMQVEKHIDMDAPMGGEAPVTLESLAAEIKALRETQESFIALVKQYGDQIAPALQGLSNSPVGKMLGF